MKPIQTSKRDRGRLAYPRTSGGLLEGMCNEFDSRILPCFVRTGPKRVPAEAVREQVRRNAQADQQTFGAGTRRVSENGCVSLNAAEQTIQILIRLKQRIHINIMGVYQELRKIEFEMVRRWLKRRAMFKIKAMLSRCELRTVELGVAE